MSLYRSKSLAALLFNKDLVRKVLRRHSALFINGGKATDTFAYVTPHIDWIERVSCEEALRRDMQRRGAHVNLEELKYIWEFYSEMLAHKNGLESKKANIAKKIGEMTESKDDPTTIEKFKIHSNLVKENLKTLKLSLWPIEENAILRALQVPNSLHERTPDSNTVLHTHLEKPKTGSDHLQYQELICYNTNSNYYYMGDAAIFELGAKFLFSNILKEHNFVQFSNPDFVKSLVVEGCGMVHTDPSASFILHHNEDSALNHNSRMHLAGGASLLSFFAYHTKNVLNESTLPLKYFSVGRQYLPSESAGDGLFGVSQSSAIEIFTLAASPNQMDQVLEELIEICKKIYTTLGHHFRLSFKAADQLLPWESLRVSIEMFSFSLGKYVEVGNVSVSGDFISKRLLLTYKERKVTRFPYVVSGTILRVPRLLACSLEQGTEFSLPQHFQVNNWAKYKVDSNSSTVLEGVEWWAGQN